MNQTEQYFDINTVLTRLFASLNGIRREKSIELIYDMEATVPRELRGDSDILLGLLGTLLDFVFEQTKEKEIVLSLGAPEDFLYEESISFRIKDTYISQEKIAQFLKTGLRRDVETLSGKVIHDVAEEIHIEIPYKINELGYRRHYRLPHVGMLHKKVLILCKSKQAASAIEKMFKYFQYDVDVGLEAYKAQGSNLALYDIAIVEQNLSTNTMSQMVIEVQKKVPLKYVVLQDLHMTQSDMMPCVSTHLVKPVTQESIFELILFLYKNIDDKIDRSTNKINHQVDIEKYLQEKAENASKTDMPQNRVNPSVAFQNSVEAKKENILPVLNKELGEKNTKAMGLNYNDELKNFLDTFDRSDLYFRQIVKEQAINKIKQFCIDLEKQSKIIGAQSMLKFTDTVSLIFVYDKLDMLVIYPGKYHLELGKLIAEIKNTLKIK
jgi:hypothetical protein